MRSFLFVPGDSERKLTKASSSTADALVLDLEDAVAGDQKAAARGLVADFVKSGKGDDGASNIYVRMNGIQTEYADLDIEMIGDACPAGVLLPKVRSLHDVQILDQKLSKLEDANGIEANSIRLIVMVSETPLSIFNMGQYVETPPRTTGFAWSGEDLAASLGAKDNRDDDGAYTDPYRIARALSLMVAAGAGVQPIDAVYTDFRNLEGLQKEAEEAARDGFAGKLAIHPDQVEIINEAFTPSEADVEHAEAVVAAFEADTAIGVIGLKNKMMDLPNLIMAQNVLARAKLAGKV